MQAPFFDALGERNGEVDLPDAIFTEKPNMPVMHQAYLRQLANARQGTASTKNRGAVSGGGAKPYLFDLSANALFKSEKVPNYHFVKLNINGGTLSAQMFRWEDDDKGGTFTERDSFTLFQNFP